MHGCTASDESAAYETELVVAGGSPCKAKFEWFVTSVGLVGWVDRILVDEILESIFARNRVNQLHIIPLEG